jgi:beta-carotene 3-hydroxylase
MAASWLLNAATLGATVVTMEVAASAVHRHVMHGPGWGWHRSHHEPGAGRFEKNDLYAILFAGISLITFLLSARWPLMWWVGAGLLVYGVLYALLHDVLVHRRLSLLKSPKSGYLKRLVQAHRLHHATKARDGAVSFGFLYAPPLPRLLQQLRTRQPDK